MCTALEDLNRELTSVKKQNVVDKVSGMFYDR